MKPLFEMPQQKLNIFLVDDDRIYQFTARKTLESMGLASQVSIFSDGEEAIEFIRQHLKDANSLPDVIFLDINMPLMYGWEFIDEFEKLDLNGKKVSVYMVSSSVDETDLKKSKEHAIIKDYIIKPVGRTRFEQLISLLPGSQSTQD
jgi:CheY-like chemotaxis protein